MKGYEKYIQKYPDSGFNYYMIGYKLKEAGIMKGVVLPAKPKNAVILADSAAKHDPYHIMHRMVERQITDDDLKHFMDEAKVMFVQWNGQRQAFYSEAGTAVITKSGTGWIYKTAFTKHDYDEESLKILEVIHRYADR